jgi:hypothetical protein
LTEENESFQAVLDEVLVRTRRNALVVHEILRRSRGWSCEKIYTRVSSTPLESSRPPKHYLV